MERNIAWHTNRSGHSWLNDGNTKDMDAKGNVRLERQALMTPPALRAMPDNQVLYLFANKRPALLTVTPYFGSRDMMRRTKTEPFRVPVRSVGAVELVPL